MELKTWQITDANGNSATVLNLGARLINWQSKASKGKNIIVGYQTVDEYLSDGAYMGAIAGPFANRIGGASYHCNGELFELDANEGTNHLHGGKDGLEKVCWELASLQKDSITLRHQHIGIKEQKSYPGSIEFLVTYKILPDNGLSIELFANATDTVPVGPTGHAYFNLGDHQQNINQHQLQLNAANYTPVDDQNIPTGEIQKVPSEFDFLTDKLIEASLDNNFVLDETDVNQPVATLSCKVSDLALEVFTDYPGLQVYTADHMSSPFVSRNAICLEPQYFPDSPNKSGFPFEFTSPEQPFHKFIRYRMSTI